MNKISTWYKGYFDQIIKNYHLIQSINSSAASLKLVDYEIDENKKEILFRVQMTGKNLFPKISSRQILSDFSILKNFNKADEKTIGELLRNYHPSAFNIKTAHILAKTYDKKSKKFLFTVKTSQESQVLIQNFFIEELLKCPHLIHSFDKEDVFQIGFELGREIGSMPLDS